MFTVVDLFAGVGGFSEGFSSARVDGEKIYQVRLLVDKDPYAVMCYRFNRPHANYLLADLSKIPSKEILTGARLTQKDQLDVLIGGPPCQGFSVLRRNRALDDPRNKLMSVFLRLALRLRPRSFVIENVPNLKVAVKGRFWAEIRERMKKQYIVRAEVLNACDYGVPQWRRRTFIVGLRRDLGIEDFTLPVVDATKRVSAKRLMPNGNGKLIPLFKPIITTEQAIGDLPHLQAGEEADFYNQDPFTDYQAARRKDSTVLFNHVARKHDEKFLRKLAKIEEGSSNQELDGRKRFDRGRDIKYLSQAYGRLHRGGIAQTITAHFLNPGSGRFTHYRDLRSITVREAARFQSFDDSFIFHGPLQVQQHLVGNAVPPLMARALAEHVGRSLVGIS